tara:strand:+ start:183 stop:635 length:453 start_codon:yes stop_codon:yes gene_type:complete
MGYKMKGFPKIQSSSLKSKSSALKEDGIVYMPDPGQISTSDIKKMTKEKADKYIGGFIRDNNEKYSAANIYDKTFIADQTAKQLAKRTKTGKKVAKKASKKIKSKLAKKVASKAIPGLGLVTGAYDIGKILYYSGKEGGLKKGFNKWLLE